MGIVRWGPPEELILKLKQTFFVDTFVETGTFRGNTAGWAAQHFAQVITVEAARELHESTKKRLAASTNIDFVLGDGPRELQKIVPRLKKPAIFWLDSHWCGEDSYGEGSECPLLAELDALALSEIEHFVLIDDARFFLSPPLRFHDREQWPNILQVLDGLRKKHADNYIIVLEDVIISVPKHARALVADYAQQVNQPKPRPAGMTQVRQGRRLVVEGAKDILRGLRSVAKRTS